MTTRQQSMRIINPYQRSYHSNIMRYLLTNQSTTCYMAHKVLIKVHKLCAQYHTYIKHTIQCMYTYVPVVVVQTLHMRAHVSDHYQSTASQKYSQS